MTTRAQFRETIKAWANFGFADSLVDSWIDMAIERINNELLHKDMIERDVGLFTDDAVLLPADWIELIHVRFVGEKPARFVTVDEYWGEYRVENGKSDRVYTIIGNSIFVSPVPPADPGKQIEITYYKEVPPFSDDDTQGQNAFYEKFPRLITFATLSMTAPYLEEDARVQTWEAQATALIESMNVRSRAARFSGSPLRIRKRSFG